MKTTDGTIKAITAVKGGFNVIVDNDAQEIEGFITTENFWSAFKMPPENCIGQAVKTGDGHSKISPVVRRQAEGIPGNVKRPGGSFNGFLHQIVRDNDGTTNLVVWNKMSSQYWTIKCPYCVETEHFLEMAFENSPVMITFKQENLCQVEVTEASRFILFTNEIEADSIPEGEFENRLLNQDHI